MADFHVRSDSVDVEQIMGQIRTRIREKRGADYTEAELQHLANVKLEKFLDSRGVRSTLVEAFRKTRVASPEPPSYEFTDETLFESPRPWLRRVRRALAPILRLFMNPDRLSAAFRVQKEANADFHRRFRAREEMDPLYYEVVHNLVLEITRLGIDVQNLKMRVESLSSRLDFDERRGRSLEGMVQRRGSESPRTPEPPRAPEGVRYADGPRASDSQSHGAPAAGGPAPASSAPAGGSLGPQEPRSDESRDRRRRRRRRRRRPGQNLASGPGGTPGPFGASNPTGDGHPAQAGGRTASLSDDVDGSDEGPEGDGNEPEDTHQ
ncbi:MAG TPA: hypothetical protein VIX35_10780 [Vicinamibacterales bacterium]